MDELDFLSPEELSEIYGKICDDRIISNHHQLMENKRSEEKPNTKHGWSVNEVLCSIVERGADKLVINLDPVKESEASQTTMGYFDEAGRIPDSVFKDEAYQRSWQRKSSNLIKSYSMGKSLNLGMMYQRLLLGEYQPMTWVLKDLWSDWDQTCAIEAGWMISHSRDTWAIHANVSKRDRFDGSDNKAREFVVSSANKGSKRHERALNAVFTANIIGRSSVKE